MGALIVIHFTIASSLKHHNCDIFLLSLRQCHTKNDRQFLRQKKRKILMYRKKMRNCELTSFCFVLKMALLVLAWYTLGLTTVYELNSSDGPRKQVRIKTNVIFVAFLIINWMVFFRLFLGTFFWSKYGFQMMMMCKDLFGYVRHEATRASWAFTESDMTNVNGKPDWRHTKPRDATSRNSNALSRALSSLASPSLVYDN